METQGHLMEREAIQNKRWRILMWKLETTNKEIRLEWENAKDY